jgi:hypothetical protein
MWKKMVAGMTAAMLSVVLLAVAAPASAAPTAQAPFCPGAVINNQYSDDLIKVRSSDTPWVEVRPGVTWWGDHQIAWVEFELFTRFNRIHYYRDNKFVRMDEVGWGRYRINPCDIAYVYNQV